MTICPDEIVVVDNEQEPATQSAFSSAEVTILPQARNLGFAGGANVGLRYFLERGFSYVWLLNNDVVVRSDALEQYLLCAAAHRNCDVIGSWIVHAHRPSVLWYGGGSFRRATGKFAHQNHGANIGTRPTSPSVRRTQWVTGCSMFLAIDAIANRGLFDEDLFLYWEDVEWQFRAGLPPAIAAIVEAPLVEHEVGGSAGKRVGAVPTTFMSRNYLKLAREIAGSRRPLWVVRWFVDYVGRPLVVRSWNRVRWAWIGALLTDASPVTVLDVAMQMDVAAGGS